jgi:hypothetical protein
MSRNRFLRQQVRGIDHPPRNEREAFAELAQQAGAAQVARMADGTLACSGRDGQLAGSIEYDADPRYEYVVCPSCGQRYQRIDFGCARHWLTCNVDKLADVGRFGPAVPARGL